MANKLSVHCKRCAYAHCNKTGCGKTYYCLKQQSTSPLSTIPYKRVKPLDKCKQFKSRGK